MRCRNCDYRLWTLRSGTCPECNTPFAPSDFEFVPNSVQFVCPHCGQCYYGTGEKGHLVPIEFDCVGCGRRVHMDQMVLVPTAGLEEDQTAPPCMPWLKRACQGFFRSWFTSIGWALVRPGKLIRSVPAESSLLEAWWFAVLTQVPVLLFGLGPAFVLPFILGVTGGGGPRIVGGIGLGIGATALMALVATVVFVALWGAVAHGLLCVLAAPAAGLRRTYQALCYSGGANVASAVPCLGFYVGWISWLVSAVIMVKDGQRVSGGRASLAVLTLPVLTIASVVGLYVWLFVSILPRISAAGAANPAQMTVQTKSAVEAVLLYAQQHNGQPPNHAAELVYDPHIPPDDLTVPWSNTTKQDIPIGATTLDRFVTLRPADKMDILRRITEALPDETVAQRLGDFVFTFHGIDFTDLDPELWLVVLCPDPDLNPPLLRGGAIYIGLADGTVTTSTPNVLPSLLESQNETRAKHGLPPLPDPRTVTHARLGAGDTGVRR